MIKFSEVIDGLEFVNDGLDTQAYFNHVKNSPVDYFLPSLISFGFNSSRLAS